jgi:hypothetical protein
MADLWGAAPRGRLALAADTAFATNMWRAYR